MKKLVKVLLLVCIMASMFCLSAYAVDGDIPHISGVDSPRAYIKFSEEDLYREGFTFDPKWDSTYTGTDYGKGVALAKEEFLLEFLDASQNVICETRTKRDFPFSAGTFNVLYTGVSNSWGTTWYQDVSAAFNTSYVRLTIDGITETFTVGVTNTIPGGGGFESQSKPICVRVGDLVQGYYDDLASAIGDAPSGAVIELQDGEYTFAPTNGGGKSLTIQGASRNGTKVSVAVGDNVEFPSYGDVAFYNLTLIEDNNIYNGFTHSNSLSITECNVEGQLYVWGVTNLKCVDSYFNQPASGSYNVYAYGASSVELTGCTFESQGRSVLFYKDDGIFCTGNISNCTFIANSMAEGKAAIEIDSSFPNQTADGAYTIKINNCTASGFDPNSSCGNELWNNKKGEKTTVFKNNKQVYPALPEAPAKAPVSNRYNVPSTADNSNVPLWAVLFLGFAAVAVVTAGKKRRS